MASNTSWMKERDAKSRNKQLAAGKDQNEHAEWMQQRDNIAKKKEEAELKAKQEEENKPEFLKNLQQMKEKSQNKPKKKTDEGPSIAELDDGTDIPPWHRPGAPEKPEWVVLLLEAAKKEAQEDDDDEDHVFVAPGPSSAPKQKQTLPPQEPEKGKPEWMKQASGLKRAPAPMNPQSPNEVEQKTQQPWMKHILKPSISPQTAKPTRSPPALGDQPEWMQERNQMNDSDSSLGQKEGSLGDSISSISSHYLLNRAKSKSAHESFSGNEKPDWMKGAALLKRKDSMEDSISSISSVNLPARSRTADDSFSGSAKPEWMKSAALLKKKSQQDSTKHEATAAEESKEEEKPWLMRGKLKPRVSPEDLKTTKIQKQLQDKPQLRRESRISKDDLTTNRVQEKLKRRLPLKKPSVEISKDDLETSIVRAKLASRPSIDDKKAPVKKEEMEWMKKKLKHRGTPSSEISDQSTRSASGASAAKDKPEWMTRASNLQQRSKENKETATERPSDENQEEKPWLMRNKLKHTFSPEDLRSSKVQEKLANKPELKKSPVPVTTQQLLTSQVQEKLSLRTGVPRRKSSFKGEEMEWMKKKLKPRAPSGESTAREANDDRPGWMKELGLQKNNSKNDKDADAGSKAVQKEVEDVQIEALKKLGSPVKDSMATKSSNSTSAMQQSRTKDTGAKAGQKDFGDVAIEALKKQESPDKDVITTEASNPPPAQQKFTTDDATSKAGPKDVGDVETEASKNLEPPLKNAITTEASNPPALEHKSKSKESFSKNATATSQREETKAKEDGPELEQDDFLSGEKERDILGILQGKTGATIAAPSVENTDLITNEHFWASLADFRPADNNDSDSDCSDSESVREMDMSQSQSTSTSSDDFLSHPGYSRSSTTVGDEGTSSLLSMPKSSKNTKKAKSRSRSSSLDRTIKKKKKEKKEKKKKKERDGDAKKKKKKEKKDKEDVSRPSD